ncbi:hypothetical protein ACFQZQ_07115 [Lysobacter koreensis]|uniref:Lipoprotein n=1 Tax=Lysobacter koreensis TaxID=266122 RepID=A0ABW2YPF2_9GAMM
MSKHITKVSLVLMAIGLAAGCGKQEVPATEAAMAPTAIENAATAPAETAAPVAGALALVDYDASAAPVPVAGGNCALDAINGGAVAGASAKVGSEVLFGGWIADASNQVPTEARLVLKGVDKAYSVPLVAGAERPDVATALEAESLKLAGYNVLAKLDVAPGSYELSIVHGPANAAASCSLNASLAVNN